MFESLTSDQKKMLFAGAMGFVGYYFAPQFVPTVQPMIIGAGAGVAGYYFAPASIVGM